MSKKTETMQELSTLTPQHLEVKQMRRKQPWSWWEKRAWKSPEGWAAGPRGCRLLPPTQSGRTKGWQKEPWEWQPQGDWPPWLGLQRNGTKARWVAGLTREWRRALRDSTDSSLEDFRYQGEKEVRVRRFYFKVGETASFQLKGKIQ